MPGPIAADPGRARNARDQGRLPLGDPIEPEGVDGPPAGAIAPDAQHAGERDRAHDLPGPSVENGVSIMPRIGDPDAFGGVLAVPEILCDPERAPARIADKFFLAERDALREIDLG